MLWIIGEAPLSRESETWSELTLSVRLVRRWYDATRRCTNEMVMLQATEHHAAARQDIGDRFEVHERWLVQELKDLRQVMAEMTGIGMPPPDPPA